MGRPANGPRGAEGAGGAKAAEEPTLPHRRAAGDPPHEEFCWRRGRLKATHASSASATRCRKTRVSNPSEAPPSRSGASLA